VKVTFTANGWDNYTFWARNDPDLLARINDLIEDAQHHPFTGLGKPEPLKARYRGWWSRRINREHRLIYRIHGTGDEQTLEIAQCRYHY
jgi:toxin YoeB